MKSFNNNALDFALCKPLSASRKFDKNNYIYCTGDMAFTWFIYNYRLTEET